MSKRAKESNENLMEILGGLSQVMRYCCRDEAFCEGVTFHQFMILAAVNKEKEMYMSDLHNILSVEKSTTTRLVNPLIKKGLVRRETAAHDSRVARLTLTGAGRETHRKVQLCLENFSRKVLGNISADKRIEVLESVKIFIAAIKNSANGCGCC